jgi:hypothetical protein
MTIIEDAKIIIESSGNNFHCKVINYFKEKGWHALISPYYTDNISNKPREIDLVVEKEFPYGDGYSEVRGTINVKLYIECKFIPQLNVFWFYDKDAENTENLVLRTTPHYEGNRYRKDHHYLKDQERVAKLFAGSNNRNLENEVIYKALNQSLNAMVYHRYSESIIPESTAAHSNILQTLEYPLIVCNNFEKFLRTDVDTDDDPIPIENNFQLEVNYAYMDTEKDHRKEFFLIDIVDFNKLDDFLRVIDDDVTSISHVIGN